MRFWGDGIMITNNDDNNNYVFLYVFIFFIIIIFLNYGYPHDFPINRFCFCFKTCYSKHLLYFPFLRVRAFFHKTVRVCHVYCNFKIGFMCRITVIFGTLKDGSLLIHTLASNTCFSYRNMIQNGVDALSKIVDAFLSKSSKFCLVRIIR